MVDSTFRRYLEEAIGSGNALVAFSAFDSPASGTIAAPYAAVRGNQRAAESVGA